MKKKWIIVLIIFIAVGIIGMIYCSWQGVVELSSDRGENGTVGNVVYMDMSTILDEQPAYVQESDADVIYRSQNLIKENIELENCRIPETRSMIGYIDALRSAACGEGLSALYQLVDWAQISLEQKEVVVDEIRKLKDFFTSDMEIFLEQENAIGDAYVIRLIGLYQQEGVNKDLLYDYANAKYMYLTIFPKENGSFTMLPRAIV